VRDILGGEIKTWFTELQKAQATVLKDMLIEIFRRNPKSLIFKGGTALAFFYGADRFSEDVDLSSDSIENYAIIDDALESFEKTYRHRIINDWENEIEQASSKFRRYHLIFMHDAEDIHTMIDYSIGKCILKPIQKDLANDYYASKISVMAPEEILAEKVRAIYSRQKGRDLYDLHHLSVTMHIRIRRDLIFDKFDEDPKLKQVKYSFLTLEKRIEDMKKSWKDLEGLVNGFDNIDFEMMKNEVLAVFRNI
jgi:predicted nucleotidyltransferase component of viral defense system